MASDEWMIVRSGLVLKQSSKSESSWKTRYAVLREAVDAKSGEPHLLLYSQSDEGQETSREIGLVDKKIELLPESEGVILDGPKRWVLRTFTKRDAEVWFEALQKTVAKAKKASNQTEKKEHGSKIAASAAVAVGAAAVSIGATTVFAAAAATGVGALGAGALAIRAHRQKFKDEVAAANKTKKDNQADKDRPDPSSDYAVVKATISALRLYKSPDREAPGALPPRLRLISESDEHQLLEPALRIIVRCGDQVIKSKPLIKISDLHAVDIQSTVLRLTSARDKIRIELCDETSSAPLAGRSLSLFELTERDAEIQLKKARNALSLFFSTLLNTLPGSSSSRSHNREETETEHKMDDNLSDDEPLDFCDFYGKAPDGETEEQKTKSTSCWFALTRLARPQQDQKGSEQTLTREESEDDINPHTVQPLTEMEQQAWSSGSAGYVDATCENGTGARVGAVGAMLKAEFKLVRQGPLYAECRAQLDRPPLDTSPDPRVLLDLLGRAGAAFNYFHDLSLQFDAIFRWDDVLVTTFVVIFSALIVYLWARDHCFALPPAVATLALLGTGRSRFTGDWVARRIDPLQQVSADEAASASIQTWRWRRRRLNSDVARLDLELGALMSTTPIGQKKKDLVLVLRHVPACAMPSIAAGVAASTAMVMPTHDNNKAFAVKCSNMLTERVRSSDTLRCVELDRCVYEKTKDRNDFVPKEQMEVQKEEIESAKVELVSTSKQKLDTSPARVGLSSRAQYEAERVLRWSSQLWKKREKMSINGSVSVFRDTVPSSQGGKCSVVTRHSTARWSVPVLRELEIDAGASGEHVPARRLPWRYSQSELWIEVHEVLPKPRDPKDEEWGDNFAPVPPVDENLEESNPVSTHLLRNERDFGLTSEGVGPLLGIAKLPIGPLALPIPLSRRHHEIAVLPPDEAMGKDTNGKPLFKLELAARLILPNWLPEESSIARGNVVDDIEESLEIAIEEKDKVSKIKKQQQETTTTTTPQKPTSNGVLGRLRRARQSALDVQNSVRDGVRQMEQWRALVEWAQPHSTATILIVLLLASYVAATTRADVLGLFGVFGCFAPGLYLRITAARSKTAWEREALALATECDKNLSHTAQALRIASKTARRTHGKAESERADSAPPVPKTARWRRMLNSVLEALPAEPELDAVFFERRRASLWRRQRRMVTKNLNATWSGFLWRKSTVWRKHFAAVRDNKLCFWYQPRHSLNGVTPVLVLALNATILLPPEDENLPELIKIHAARPGSDKLFEWQLAAASRADALKLRKLITESGGDLSKKRQRSPSLLTTLKSTITNDESSQNNHGDVLENATVPTCPVTPPRLPPRPVDGAGGRDRNDFDDC